MFRSARKKQTNKQNNVWDLGRLVRMCVGGILSLWLSIPRRRNQEGTEWAVMGGDLGVSSSASNMLLFPT